MKLIKHILTYLLMTGTVLISSISGSSKGHNTFENHSVNLSKTRLATKNQNMQMNKETKSTANIFYKEVGRNKGKGLYKVECTFEGDFEFPDFFLTNEHTSLHSLDRDWDPEGDMRTYTFYNVPEGEYDLTVAFYSSKTGKNRKAHIVL